MTRLGAEEFVPPRSRFRWEAFLPKRKAWIQTLILLPFGVHVANFLGASWQFSAHAIGVEQQYLLGASLMVINLLLPSLFFACLFHGGSWVLGKQESSTWYPKTRALSAGAAATLTIAVSFGMVGLLTHSFGICRNPATGNIAQSLLCNLDNYNFESKSWFGAWFIIAAYCYQAQSSIESRIAHRLDRNLRRFAPEHDFATVTVHDDYHANSSTDPIGNGDD